MLPMIYLKEMNEDNSIKELLPIDEYFSENLLEILKSLASHNTKDDTIKNLMNKISMGSSEEIFNSLIKSNTQAQKLSNKIKNIRMEDKIFEEIKIL
ncbi:hypothetical protein ACT7DM_16970 [Bacillus cereus]